MQTFSYRRLYSKKLHLWMADVTGEPGAISAGFTYIAPFCHQESYTLSDGEKEVFVLDLPQEYQKQDKIMLLVNHTFTGRWL